MLRSSLDAKSWLVIAALSSLTLLVGAHAFETFGRYEPCELCYRQRDIHWAAFWVSGLAFAVTSVRPSVARIACGAVAVIFLCSTVLATYHTGVEWKWWPGPASCTGGHFKAVSAADMASLLNGTSHVVACDDAAWRMFGVSMAGYNALISALIAALSVVVAWRGALVIGGKGGPTAAAESAPGAAAR
jgi:disulfide bond formation protein DsbB